MAFVMKPDGSVAEVPDTELAVSPPPPEVQRYSKAALFSTMTDAEYDTFATVQGQQPARERAIFEHATEIAEDHPLYTKFHQLLVGAYGEARAAELLTAARL